MKIMTVVGARPQFIKSAVVSRELRKYHDEVLVHTGQHFDYNMSEIFFNELDMPMPNYNLGVSGGTHGKMTGEMLCKIEEIMIKEKPDCTLVYGDTNSTIAAALASAKLNVPVVHVEAGIRLKTLENPEEINRVVTDHVSALKLYCTESAYENLKNEGILENSYLVGDPMYDAFLFYSSKLGRDAPEKLVSIFGNNLELPKKYNYLTCHRAENTKNTETLEGIVEAMECLNLPTIYPVHPRNKKDAQYLQEKNKYKNVLFCEPVGYLMSVFLMNNCEKVVTDSGGLQREAFFAGKQCVTVFDRVIWPETMIDNRNQLAKPEQQDILNKLSIEQHVGNTSPFGDGKSAVKIVEYINNLLSCK